MFRTAKLEVVCFVDTICVWSQASAIALFCWLSYATPHPLNANSLTCPAVPKKVVFIRRYTPPCYLLHRQIHVHMLFWLRCAAIAKVAECWGVQKIKCSLCATHDRVANLLDKGFSFIPAACSCLPLLDEFVDVASPLPSWNSVGCTPCGSVCIVSNG